MLPLTIIMLILTNKAVFEMNEVFIKNDSLNMFANKLRIYSNSNASYSVVNMTDGFLRSMQAYDDIFLFNTIERTQYESFVMPDTITRIKDHAFEGCVNLSLSTLPDSVESIGTYAFSLCRTLTSLSLPVNLKNIDSYAFEGSYNLQEITFNSKPTTISSAAFSGCNYLKTINVPWSEGEVAGAPWGATNATINYNYK